MTTPNQSPATPRTAAVLRDVFSDYPMNSRVQALADFACRLEKELSATPSPSLPDDGATPKVDYSVPTPRTKAFILQIDDSSVDMGQVEAHSHDLECELIAATREIAAARRELRGYRMAYAGQKGKADGLETRETTLLTELSAAQRERDEAKDQLAGRVAVPDSPLRHDEWVRLLEKERTRAETAEAQIEDYKRAYNECWAGSPAVKTELDKLRTQSSHVEEMAKALEEIFSYKTADHDMIVDEEFLAPHRAVVARYRSAQKENTL